MATIRAPGGPAGFAGGSSLTYHPCMRRSSRAKPLHLRGLALLVLLAVGVIGQPLVDSVAELHESVLHADAGEAYTHHHDHLAHHDESTGNDGGKDSGSALHLLLHQPCGGHCVFIAMAHVQPMLSEAMHAAIPDEFTRRIPPTDYTAPFRPPIAA